MNQNLFRVSMHGTLNHLTCMSSESFMSVTTFHSPSTHLAGTLHATPSGKPKHSPSLIIATDCQYCGLQSGENEPLLYTNHTIMITKQCKHSV